MDDESKSEPLYRRTLMQFYHIGIKTTLAISWSCPFIIMYHCFSIHHSALLCGAFIHLAVFREALIHTTKTPLTITGAFYTLETRCPSCRQTNDYCRNSGSRCDFCIFVKYAIEAFIEYCLNMNEYEKYLLLTKIKFIEVGFLV